MTVDSWLNKAGGQRAHWDLVGPTSKQSSGDERPDRMTEMLQLLMEDRRLQTARWRSCGGEKAAGRGTAPWESRVKDCFKDYSQSRTTHRTSRKLAETDDIEAYLTTFERMNELICWPMGVQASTAPDWTSAEPTDEATDYETVNTIQSHDLTKES